MSAQMRRVLLTKRKHTDIDLYSEPISTSAQMDPFQDNLSLQALKQAAEQRVAHNQPQSSLYILPDKYQTSTPVRDDRVKSESRSNSSSLFVAPTAIQPRGPMPTPAVSSTQNVTSVNSLVSAMVDTTAYIPPSAKSPPASGGITTGESRLSREPPAIDLHSPPGPIDGGHGSTGRQSDVVSVQDPFQMFWPTDSVDRGDAQQSDASRVSTRELPAPLSTNSPHTSSPSFQWRQILPPLSSPLPSQSSEHVVEPIHDATPQATQTSTPRSLYPGPSATVSPANVIASTLTKKRSRAPRLDDPERFMYAGNTFSNLDDQTFHETAEKNPYLTQLTADATRPVYKSPHEARQAIKATRKAATATPPDPNKQIRQLNSTIADFRKKYDKAKMMTKQAGIEVSSNVWDRLLNLTQYPPDLNGQAEKGSEVLDMEKYVEQMQVWDRAIGHQVIIKKRVVYKEAIEELQRKLDNLRAERELDVHRRPAGGAKERLS